MKNILVIDSGARGDAIGWKLAQSPRVARIFTSPGNAGTARRGQNLAFSVTQAERLAACARGMYIDMAVIGPDEAVAAGVADAFKARSIPVWGASRDAGRIESSKQFGKKVMAASGIPTAPGVAFTKYGPALEYARRLGCPLVIKPDGLTRGQGVKICRTEEDLVIHLGDLLLHGKHGEAGKTAIVETFIDGFEATLHAFSDGNHTAIMPAAQDYKLTRAGSMCGGMGSYCPHVEIAPEILPTLKRTVVDPAITYLGDLGTPFIGCLYPGIKIHKDEPYVIEYNARFGDPEAQVYMRLLKTDLLDIIEACVNGTLDSIDIEWHSGYAVCVVLATGGYPEERIGGAIITGIREAERVKNVVIFHGATTREGGDVITTGGRALSVTARGDSLDEARALAYEAVARIRFDGMQFNENIGLV